VSDLDFDERVLHSTQPVLVEFTAEWCPPCRVLAPSFARTSDAYEGRLRFMTMDTDENLRVQARFGVQGIPTLALFVGGKLAGRVVGPHPGRLQQIVDRLLAEASVEAPMA
jgi:thioredoxin 1